jgi:hypothetical protein
MYNIMINLKTMDKAEIANRFISNYLDCYLTTEQAVQANIDKAIKYNDAEYVTVLQDWLPIVRSIRNSEQWDDIKRCIEIYDVERGRSLIAGEFWGEARAKRQAMRETLCRMIADTIVIESTQLELF